MKPLQPLFSKLEGQLTGAGLSCDFNNLLGAKYYFEYEGGSHFVILLGTITGIQISDEGGLELKCSSTQFRGFQLLGFYWNPDDQEWEAHINASKPEFNYHSGNLIFL